MVGYRVYLGADRIVGGEEGGVMKDQKLVILDSSVVCRSWTRSDESEEEEVWGQGPQPSQL